MKKNILSKNMTVIQFNNGYWYALELKAFGKSIGIPSANRLRKDELEEAIKTFLKSGKVCPTKRCLSKTGIKDISKGLSLKLRVINYTSNRETKDFIVKEALKIAPDLKRKSGARYQLNRWRERLLTQGRTISYQDLVKQYVKLNQGENRMPRVPHGRYINFISDFLTKEKNTTKEQAIKAWKDLKKMDVPKDYQSWLRSIKIRHLGLGKP